MNPLLKKPSADPGELKNYRPISLLPFLAKVTEKAITIQPTIHLENHDLLDSSQSGFRAKRSTETALVTAMDDN